jgi:hypothetical protein
MAGAAYTEPPASAPRVCLAGPPERRQYSRQVQGRPANLGFTLGGHLGNFGQSGADQRKVRGRSAAPLRIAVLHEASATPATVQSYSIATLSMLWQRAGHSVVHLFGPRSYACADIAVVHVDLSVVPEGYVALAHRYPVALNTRVTDIRKCQISRNLLQAQDAYAGPVIVKSNLNAGGWPEKLAFAKKHRWSIWKKRSAFTRFASSDYPIYASIAEVPSHYWEDPLLVVEKFLPECVDGFYFLRQSYFFGERHRSWQLRSSQPIVRATSFIDDVEILTPEGIDTYRREIGLDYGKIDFVEHDGKITILDVSKTIGAPAPPVTTHYLAPAIESLTLALT